MAISLYDITVPGFLQGLRALQRVLAKGRRHWEEAGRDLAEIPELRLAPDMLPFRYQIEAAVNHSLDAVKGALQGWFTITMPKPDLTLDDLDRLLAEAVARLEAVDRAALEARVGQDLEFRFRDTATPYVAQDFLTSFSLPNFYFHATTAYDLLRREGVKLGKRDFLGELRTKPAAA